MNRFSFKLAFLVAGMLMPVIGNAQLVWENTVHEGHLKGGEIREIAEFAFENKGRYPITITKVHTSCGCTSAESNKYVYYPKEKGVIKAVFNFGNRKGFQEKRVIIETDDKSWPRETLMLRVDLPDILKISTRELAWKVAEPIKKKAFDIVIEKGAKVKVENLITNGGFKATLDEVNKGMLYRVVVEPLSVQKRHRGLVQLDVLNEGVLRKFRFKVSVN